MELVWKNECGSELGRKRYNPDTTDVHEVLAGTDWILGIGDTLTLEQDKLDSEVLELLRCKVDEIFVEIQNKYGVKTYDCDPGDEIILNERTEDLASRIAYILKMQIREDDIDNKEE